MNSELYFFAILFNDELNKKVRDVQLIFKERFESQRQLKIPPHITLIPPFRAAKEEIESITNSLLNFSFEPKLIEVQLEDFGFFEPRVCYIAVKHTEELSLLHKELHRFLNVETGFTSGYDYSKFTPHVTLANRDLTTDNFYKAKEFLQNEQFSENLQISSISLMKHVNGLWQKEHEFIL